MDKLKWAHHYYEQGKHCLAEARANGYAMMAQIVEAEQNFQLALEHHPKLLAALLGMAYVKALQGHKESALQLLNQAEKVAPNDPKLHQLKQDTTRMEEESRFSEIPPLALYLESITFYSQRISHMQTMDLDYAPYMHFLKKK